MSDQQQVNEPTADEQERVAEVESYGGIPVDDQEMADVWTSGGSVDTAEPEHQSESDEPAPPGAAPTVEPPD